MSLLPIVASVIKVILPHCFDSLFLHLGYPFKTKSNVLKLINFMERLEARRDDVNMEIEIAKRREQTSKFQVNEWLRRVEATKIEAEAIKDAYENRNKCLRQSSLNMISSYKISRRAVKKLKEAMELFDRGAFEVLVVDRPPPSVEEKPLASIIVGMELKLKQVLFHLSDEKIGIVGLWGMGGVGKTTLLKVINNHFLGAAINNCFDHVICITASGGCKVESVQMDIANKVGLYLKQDTENEFRASTVFNFLKNKKFLLLLDDLWDQVDLERIGVPEPNGRKGQKIVLATRFEEICGKMKAQTKIKLECLEPNEAWELFKDNVGEQVINFDARIQPLAKKVCEKCNGLPLALISIGRAMSSKKTWREWENSVTFMRSTEMSEASGMKDFDPILNTLRFSYDSLEDDILKECFLTCSLWPKSYSIWIVDLVNCWIGLGLLALRKTYEETYNEGYSRVERLKKVSLLDSGDLIDTEVRLHDVICDMAFWIISRCAKKPDWIVYAGIGLKRMTKDDNERWACAERISLMCNYIESLPQGLHCPNLSVLILQQNFHLKVIPQNFFQSMASLTYLDLRWTSITELPKEIGSLVKLQYLDLQNTNINSLRVEFGCLIQLRFLNLSYTDHLKKIPNGVISRLSRLEVFNLFQSAYTGFERKIQKGSAHSLGSGMINSLHVSDANDEFSLEELHHLDKGLKVLGISILTVSTLRMLSTFADKYLYLLAIRELEGESSLYLKLHSGIKVLNIRRSFSLEELLIEREDDINSNGYFPRLEYLTIWCVPRLKRVILAEQLRYLRRINIIENNSLTHISWILRVPFLEQLDLSFCNKLKQIVCNFEDEDNGDGIEEDLINAFSKLRIVQLNHLPLLERFSSKKMEFPSLQYIDVFDCPLLKQLPFQVQFDTNTNGLRQIRGEEKWWNSLEWDNSSTCSSFQPFFKVFENNIETIEPNLETNPFMSSSSSFFTRRQPMMRTALQFSSYVSLMFGDHMP